MNELARALVATALLLAVAACGSDDGVSQADDPPASTASGSPSSAPAPADGSVASVTLRRSGGLKGEPLDRSFVVGETPPQGFTAGDQDKVIEAAQQFVDADISLPEMPENTCCDRYTYVVVVRLADGTSMTFTAVDGEPLPRAFSDLLGRLS